MPAARRPTHSSKRPSKKAAPSRPPARPAARPTPKKAKPAAKKPVAKAPAASKPAAKASSKPVAPPLPELSVLLPGGRRHVLSLSFLRDGDEFLARLETDAGQITELKNRSLDQLLTLVAGELEDLLL